MKRLFTLTVVAILSSAFANASPGAEALLPGQVDYGKFAPSTEGSDFVEVNLSGSLISLAARIVEKEEPEVARLLNNVKLVRVNVIGLNEGNRADLKKRVEKIRKELDATGWERTVVAQKEEQDVGVYLKTQGTDTVQGVFVLVTEADRQAVFVNVVGDIKPDQLALLGDKLNIDPLKHIGKATRKAEARERKGQVEEKETK
jgi:hypothetical protein